MKLNAGTALAAPSVGPAMITLFGIDIPVMAMCLSVAGLILARVIAPPPLRKLTRTQEVCLTLLLLLVLFLITTGQISSCSIRALFGHDNCPAVPLGAGMASIWGIGLGFSGLLAIEFFGARFMAAFRAIFGTHGHPKPPED